MEQGVDQAVGDAVEDPDDDAHDQHAEDDGAGLLESFLSGGPGDLLQLGLHLPEEAAQALAEAGLLVLLLGLLFLLGLGGLFFLGGLGLDLFLSGLDDLFRRLVQVFLFRHSVPPFFHCQRSVPLLRLAVNGMLSAEGAVLVHL